ncbi:MAG TPA: hypothetical protein VN181_00345, partial [Thermoanaerobaculia bacterium]|nr:hypothetical protein [Thermoanaerobaculia bacterium]
MSVRRLPYVLFLLVVSLIAPAGFAQVNLTTLGSPIPTQTFDNPPNTNMPTTGGPTWANNSTVLGWYHARTGTGTTILADAGGGTAGALYSYGTGTNADRALGSIGSGNAVAGNFFWGVRLHNNTGATITSLDVSYIGEEWRKGGGLVAQVVSFSYLTGATVTGTLSEFQSPGTAVTQLDFSSPVNTAGGAALDGNAAANRTAIAFTITGLSIANGTEIMLRWSDPDHSGTDHGLAIDDVNVTPHGAPANAPVVPSCPPTLTTNFGSATSSPVSATDADGTVISATITGITPSNPGTITLTGFTPAGGVAATASATLNVSNSTPVGSYNVTIQWANNDGVPQTANCVVGVTVNQAPTVVFISQVQGPLAATG